MMMLLTQNIRMRVRRMHGFRVAITAAVFLSAACASNGAHDVEEWAAHGFLKPVPEGESEVIGLFDDYDDCEDAAEAWASRQVVGNPVYAACYPVDKN